MVELQIAKICSFMQPNSWIGPQHRCQLIAADVNGDHLLAAAVQQDLGEATGRRARVEGSSSHAELEIIKCTDELVGTARDVPISGCIDVGRCGTWSPGRSTTEPSTTT